MLPLCAAEGIGVHPVEPAGARPPGPALGRRRRARSETDEFGKTLYAKTDEADRKVVERGGGRSPPSAACRGPRSRWPGCCAKPVVTAPIVGATKPQHLDDAVAAPVAAPRAARRSRRWRSPTCRTGSPGSCDQAGGAILLTSATWSSLRPKRRRGNAHPAGERLPWPFRSKSMEPSTRSTSTATRRCCGCCATCSGMTGTKFGCGMACAAPAPCIVDGSRRAPASRRIDSVGDAEDHHHRGDRRHARRQEVQQAWLDLDVAQCGYCQSGQIMSATALLAQHRRPERRRHRRGDDRQHLPLRHLRAHPRRRSNGQRRPPTP